MDIATLTELLREAENRHGEYEPTAPKHHWSGRRFFLRHFFAPSKRVPLVQAASVSSRRAAHDGFQREPVSPAVPGLRLARQQELIELLQRRMKYDRLGVNDALLQLDNDISKGVLPEPQRVLPILDQIAGDYRFVEIARQRARALAERIRHGREV